MDPPQMLDATPDTRPLVITLEDVRKTYLLGHTPADRLREALGFGRPASVREHKAVDGVSATIRKGESIGILGVNGAGKSTLLQMITGTLKPTSGRVVTHGRIAALLELGAGFNPEWSGRRNAELQCVLQGVAAAEMAAMVADIEAFADIGAYFDQPTRTYSSGMFLRVAFASSVATAPDILIVDEALAVGDVKFQNKCFRRFEEMQETGCTVLFVTHSPDLVTRFCTRCIVMQAGRVMFDGSAATGVARYLDLLHGPDDAPLTPAGETEASPLAASASATFGREMLQLAGDRALRPHYNKSHARTGKGFTEIVDVMLSDGHGQELPVAINSGTKACLRVWTRANSHVSKPFIGWIIKQYDDSYVYGSNTILSGLSIPEMQPNKMVVIDINIDLRLGRGHYFIDIGSGNYSETGYESGDWLISAVHFSISEKGSFFGAADLSARPALVEA